MNAKVQCCLLRHARQQSRSRESYPWLMYSCGYEKDALLRLEQVMNCGPGPSCWKGGYRYPLDKFLSSGNVIRWIVIFPVDSAIRVQKQPGPERSEYKGFCCTQRAIRKVFAKRATARLVALFWPLVCLIRMSHLPFLCIFISAASLQRSLLPADMRCSLFFLFSSWCAHFGVKASRLEK